MLGLKPEKKPDMTEPIVNTVNPSDLSINARGNTWRNIQLIVSREYRARVYRRIFVIATVIMVVLVILASFVPTLVEFLSSNSQTKINVIDNAGSIAGQPAITYLDQSLNLNLTGNGNSAVPGQSTKAEYLITKVTANETDAIRKKVQSGDLDALLTINRNSNGDLVYDYYTKNSTEGLGATRVRQALTVMSINDRLSRAGLPQAQVAQLFSPPEIKAVSTSQEKAGQTDAERGVSYLIAFLLVIVLFMTIYGYGVAVAQGAAEEKSNRVMEIMISAATPFQLMMGKIIGIGLAGFTQVAVLVVAGIGAFLLQNPIKSLILGNKTGGTQIDITNVSISALAFFLVFYVLGFLLYASLYAAIGSLVSRQEDVQAALTPLSIINTAGYMVAVFGLQAVDSTWVTVLSYFPFFTPFLMFGRLALGTATWWEGLLSVGILLVCAMLFTWLSSRVYRAGVLMYGRKPSTRQIFKLMWAKGR